MHKQLLYHIKNNISLWTWGIISLSLCFFPLLCHFTWGNHDWMPIKTDIAIHSGSIEGRFSQYLLLNLLLMGKILPILNIIIGFAIYITAIILLYRYFFKFSAPEIITTLFVISTITLPYITEILYFHFITFSLLCWPLLITFSLIFAQKASQSHPVTNLLLSIPLLFIAIGGYPASIGLYITACCLWIIQQTTISTLSIKKLLHRILPFLLTLIIAIFPIIPIYKYLQQNHLMLSLYNTHLISISEVISKIPSTLLETIQQLFLPQPYFPITFKLLTSSIFLLFFYKYLSFAFKKKFFILAFLLSTSLLLSLKFSAFISTQSSTDYFAQYDPTIAMVRLDFYTIPCFVLFCLFFLYKNSSIQLKNTIYLITIFLLCFNITSNLKYTKTQILGFNAENKLLDRTITRIQETQQYQKNKLYTIIQAGEFSLRSKYYQPTLWEKYGYYTLQAPFTRYWVSAEYYNFYTPKDFIKGGNSISHITPNMTKFLTQKMEVWPSLNAIYIDDTYIILPLSDSGEKLLKNQFQNLIKE